MDLQTFYLLLVAVFVMVSALLIPVQVTVCVRQSGRHNWGPPPPPSFIPPEDLAAHMTGSHHAD